jgi:hypothetical protein
MSLYHPHKRRVYLAEAVDGDNLKIERLGGLLRRH